MSKMTSSPPFTELIRQIQTEQGSHLNLNPREQEIAEEDDVLGIESLEQNLIDLLTRNSSSWGDSRRKTISVVGPGGSGKTVLVNAVYKRKTIMEQFDCQAWLSIPDSYKTEQLLQKLLSQMISNGTNKPSTGNTATTLNTYLLGKRYLVGLDYVWRGQDLTDIRSKLPDHQNDSRIIITTRYVEVAEKCCTSDEYILGVNVLDQKQSWRLFCKKAFGNGKCPPPLQELAQRIVTRCEGLPRAISAVGSLLSRKGDQPAEWQRIHDNLGSQIQANCSSAMLRSYYDLSSSLKMCLLHFSILPEDRSIKRERLIRLWLSEGIVEKQNGNEPPETMAEDSLNELISRNLVTVSSRDFKGRVRSCRVPNLIRELILRQSKDAKFIEVVKDSYMHPRQEANEKTRRLSIEYASSSSMTRAKRFELDTVRSLFMFGFDKSSSLGLLEILQRIRLLKILDLEDSLLDAFPDCILDVALLLRYLSLRNTNVSVVPQNIKKLRYLEYLDLKETQVTKLPEEIWSLQYLQHLLVSFRRLQGVEIVGELRVVQFLQKLSIIKISHNPGFFEFLQQLTLLKKLGLVNLSKDDGKPLCACIDKMPYLSTLDLTSRSKEECLDLDHMEVYHVRLQHMYLKGRLTGFPKWFPCLSGLVRLLLRWSKLRDSPVELLQKLPNLMELEMNDAFTGEVLLFEAEGFRKLRTLRIEQFDGLDTVKVFPVAMPMLQKLTFVSCPNLHYLPLGIKGLRCLEELLLWDMPQEFTGRLSKGSGDHDKVNHVPCIRSHTFNAAIGAWEMHNYSSSIYS